MKKTYNAPQLNIVRVDNSLMTTNVSGGGSGEKGTHADSRYNSVDFTDDEDYDW